MSLDDDAYNLDAVALARPPWPDEVPAFDDALDDADLVPSDASVRATFESLAQPIIRWTCRLTAARVRDWFAAPGDRRLIVHAIDADPTVPLLMFWSLRRAEALARAIEWLRDGLAPARVLVVLPDDAPRRYRNRLRKLRPTFADAAYPAGNWRLLPRVLRLPSAGTLVLDAAAAIDLYLASIGVASPVPLAIAANDVVEFRTAPRGERVSSVVRCGDAGLAAIAGPRLREVRAAPDAPLGDGELTYHVIPKVATAQSPCVRCGWCVKACPTRCDPVALMRLTEHPAARRAADAGLASCIDCGLCTAVCPSRLPLHGMIDALRERLRGER